jgi:uncharacterized GH25 family protein
MNLSTTKPKVEKVSHVLSDEDYLSRQAKRLKTAQQLYWTARRFKKAMMADQHPEWNAEKLASEVRASFMHSSLLNR